MFGWQRHALAGRQLHPHSVTTADLQRMGLMCLEHVVANFDGTFDIFTEEHRGADLPLDNIFASYRIF